MDNIIEIMDEFLDNDEPLNILEILKEINLSTLQGLNHD